MARLEKEPGAAIPALDLWLIVPKQKAARVVEYVTEMVLHRTELREGYTLKWTKVECVNGTIGKSSSLVVLTLATEEEAAVADATPAKREEWERLEAATAAAVVEVYEDIHLAREVHMFLPFPAGMTWEKDLGALAGAASGIKQEQEDTAMAELIEQACRATLIRYDCAKSELCYRVQCYPRKRNQQLIDQIPLDIDLHPKRFRHVLTFIYESDAAKMTCSVSPSELFYNFDLRSARDASGTGVCRASFKLSETVHRLSHGRPGEGASVPALDLTKIDRALDIGAAPGGWTAVLVALGVGEVIAIDPGMFDDDVIAMPGVKHMRMRVETATPLLLKEGKKVDLVMCDMNMGPLAAAKIVTEVAPLLKDECWLVFTMKGPLRFSEIAAGVARDCFEIFAPLFPSLTMRHLLCNGDERTIIGYRNL